MQDKIWFFAAVGRWGSRVNQPGAYFNPLQGIGQIRVVEPRSSIRGSPDAVRQRPYDTGRAGRQLRLVSDPRRCASTWQATEQQQVRLLRRHPEVVPLHDRTVHRRQRDRIGARLGLVAVRRRPGHLDGAGHEPAAARSRRVVADGQLGELRRDGRDARRPIDPRAVDQLPVRRDDSSDGADCADRPQRPALLGVVRHRHPQPEGRGSPTSRASTTSRAPQPPRRPQLRLPERPADPRSSTARCRSTSRSARTTRLASSRRMPGHLSRFTLNLGLRWDYITMGFPAADLPPVRIVPARHVDELKRRARMDRHQPACRRGDRRLRQRPNRGQGVDRPLQPVEPQRLDAALPSVQLVGQHGVPRLERHQRQLHSGLRVWQISLRNWRVRVRSRDQYFGQFIPRATHFSTTR